MIAQSHKQVRERDNQSDNTRCIWESTLPKTPLSVYCIKSRIMKQYNAFSHKRTPALYQLSHTDLGEIEQILRQFFASAHAFLENLRPY